jgi:LPS sulfotransferase NodH
MKMTGLINGPARQWLAGNYYSLMFAGLDRRLVPGHDSYTRFIVLGRPRTGSTFLRSALNNHRELFTFGELFRHDQISWEPHLGRPAPRVIDYYSNHPVEFVENRVYRSYPAHIRAVGFKIFYHHAHKEFNEPIWSYLYANPHIRVVHIERRNLLKTYVSHKLAFLTGTWKLTKENGRSATPAISLTYEECEEEFRTATEQEQSYATRFANHPVLMLVYEDLVKYFDREVERLEDFLGVTRLTIQPTTLQQSKRPLSQQIVNYHELKEQFQNTRWAEFFVE